MNKIGIAISGGGHRASLFGLGVLLYLADAGKNRDVRAISSVSGGSITNAHVGLSGDYAGEDSAAFRASAADLAGQIANRGTLFAWRGTWIYLVATVVAAIAAFAVWLIPGHWLLRLMLFVVAIGLWDVLFWRRRGDICARAYAATVLNSTQGRAKLSVLADRPIDHIMCATHLNAGEHLYLSGRFVYSYRFGWGTPGHYPLDQAVQASTALPGAFPPRWVSARDFTFSKSGGAPSIPLVDGGVYDNMADQWFKGLSTRDAGSTPLQIPDEVVLVNASSSMGMSPVGKLRLPIFGEILAMQRDISIMYDNSASLRKSDLIARFDRTARDRNASAHDGNSALLGSLLDIGSSPYAAPDFFANSTEWPERSQRATAALKILQDMSRDDWRTEARFSSGVATSLSKLGTDTSARILRHAYALASVNLHVILNYPLLPIPKLENFNQLCGGSA